MSKIIGIDLGTTNSVVAVMEAGQPKVLVNEQGARLTPSVVAFTDKGERLVGTRAKNQQVTNPTNTVYSIKRFMGRRHNEVGHEEKIVPFQITGGPDELVKVKVGDKEYAPPEISAMVLRDLKATAERYLGQKVERAVITVPAYFNDSQRQATKEAGQIAGLKVERIINEPTAAALAYGLENKTNAKIAVFDFGGGTFDISILDVGDNVFEVLSTNGDTHLGGDDIDEELINYLADDFRKREGIDLTKDPMALQRLKEAAERAKCELSTSMETTINLPYITADSSGPKHLQITITRAKFEQLIEPLVERLRGPVMKALQDAKLSPSDVADIAMVGGSTRIPMVQKLVTDIFVSRTESRHQSRRGRCDGRRGTRRGADRRKIGHRAARRDAAFTRCRDAWWRDDPADHALIRRSQLRRRKYSLPPPTVNPPWISMCCKANVRWPTTIGRWAGSS